jgi:hypothetical protein
MISERPHSLLEVTSQGKHAAFVFRCRGRGGERKWIVEDFKSVPRLLVIVVCLNVLGNGTRRKALVGHRGQAQRDDCEGC